MKLTQHLTGGHLMRQQSNQLQNHINVIEKKLHEASLEIEIQFRRDNRQVARMQTISQLTMQLSLAWLKVIPHAGGYFALLNKALQNPGGGTWEVMRSSYGKEGSSWNLWGDYANGVSSPLTVDGAQGYNLATGSPTLFQQDQRMKCEQAESEMMGMLKLPGISSLITRKGNANAQAVANKLQELDQQALSYLSDAYEDKETAAWAKLHALGAASIGDLSSHDGVKDLNAGTVMDANGDLLGKNKIDELDQRRTFMAKRQHTFGSSLYNALCNFVSSEGRQNVIDKLKFNLSTLQMVQRIKAKYVAYYGTITKSSVFSSMGKYIAKELVTLGTKSVLGRTLTHSKTNLLEQNHFRHNLGGRFIGAIGLIHELIAAYFGSGRICSLPPTSTYAKQVAYCLEDCALVGASYMSRDTSDDGQWQSWHDWFVAALKQMPEVRAFNAMLKENNVDSDKIDGIEIPGLSEFDGYGGKGWYKRPKNFSKHTGTLNANTVSTSPLKLHPAVATARTQQTDALFIDPAAQSGQANTLFNGAAGNTINVKGLQITPDNYEQSLASTVNDPTIAKSIQIHFLALHKKLEQLEQRLAHYENGLGMTAAHPATSHAQSNLRAAPITAPDLSDSDDDIEDL